MPHIRAVGLICRQFARESVALLLRQELRLFERSVMMK